MVINTAYTRDCSAINKLESNSYPQALPFGDILMRVMSPTTVNLVAKNNQDLLGYLLAELDPVSKSIYIARITTDPKVKQKGIASALLKELELIAKQSKIPITLHVRSTNIPAIKLYLHNQYKPIRILRHYYPDSGELAIIFKKS